MKIFINEIEIKKKFNKKDLFIHFTTKNRAKRIIKDKTLKAKPEGITNFGPSKIYAVSVEYGRYIPKVQVTHLKKMKEKDDSGTVAILFSTPIKPQATFIEETFWKEEEIPIKIHKILSINQAQNILNKNNNEKIKDDQDYIIYEGKRDVYNLPKYIYHQTDIQNAKEILKNGFEYGGILGKGEHTFGIYFAPTYLGMKNVNYSRGTSGKNIMVQVKTDGLNLFDTSNLKKDQNLPSYKQPEYIMMQNIETRGIFPKGYDGVIRRNEYENNNIYEIILKKEAANKNITGNLLNARGRIINEQTLALNENNEKPLPKIPDIVYHGQAPKYEYIGNGKKKSSIEKIETFSNNYKRFLQKEHEGFYFTPDKALARVYAESGYVYTCTLDIKNPYYYFNRYSYGGGGLIKNPSFMTKEDIYKLQKNGYDAVASLDIVGKIMEIIVFHPNQIKTLNVEKP